MTLSHEEFLKRSTAKHKNFYDYSEAAYTGYENGVVIICPKHGRFEQPPKRHMMGKGCPGCGRDKRAESRQNAAADKFIAQAQSMPEHAGKNYSYDKAMYNGATTELTVTCLAHDIDFSITPHLHLRGSGCPKCSAERKSLIFRHTKEQFIEQGETVHSVGAYDYSGVVYVNRNTPVEIRCKEHGAFEQTPGAHIAGSGCRKCANYGYRPNKPGTLYVLYAEGCVKVGITNRSVRERLAPIARTSNLQFEIVLAEVCSDGEIPLSVEADLLKELRSKYEQPRNKFDGSTECFLTANVTAVIERARELISLKQSG